MSELINYSIKNIESLSGSEAELLISVFLKKDFLAINQAIPDLIKHKFWRLRCEIVYKIGFWGMSQFLDNVLDRLNNDKNVHVRCYALSTCYELMWKDAIPLLRKYSKTQNIQLRLTALTMLYISANEGGALEKISKIVMRKNCKTILKSVFVNTINAYIVLEDHPKVFELLRRVAETTDPDLEIVKDIGDMLKEAKENLAMMEELG